MLTIKEAINLFNEGKITTADLLKESQIRFEKYKDLNMFITSLYLEAEEIINSNKDKLLIPFSLKDNFLVQGVNTTAASKVLSKFKSPYDSTVYSRFKNYGLLTGKTNMDEFAMGSSGKTSAYGICKSPWKNPEGDNYSPGGSSSGSAVSVATGVSFVSFGTDTGGSVRQPAAWCGIVGFKPTYGLLSRYGVVDFSSAMDTPGIMARTVEDVEWTFNKILGEDKNDFTTIDYEDKSTNYKRVGVISNFIDSSVEKVIEILKDKGFNIKEYNLPILEETVPVYCVLNMAEASSNLSRYNGIFYSDHIPSTLEEAYKKFRSNNFGEEAIRRIMAGDYIMLSANIDEFYKHAKKIQSKIWEDFEKIFNEVDFLLSPTAPSPMTVKETIESKDPTTMYKCDKYTSFCNLIGIPALTIPLELNEEGAPIGIQLIGRPLGDKQLLREAKEIEKDIGFTKGAKL